jgi:hypothetical protein
MKQCLHSSPCSDFRGHLCVERDDDADVAVVDLAVVVVLDLPLSPTL